ncbi:DUF3000 domain-containing protein [Pseudonocardia hispaniensis]|uniref:DUF3000 domain-containing protein n=1 Tax=Pseudonocardia hispaniensis TaxID=904933 RepID=A0ABW1IYB0_9PSEU
MSEATAPPPSFRRAVASLSAVRPRPELVTAVLDAPPRLAPHSWALRVEADIGHRGDGQDDLDAPDTFGTLILLHDPAGQDRWAGTFRLVCFVQARLEPEQPRDDLLPEIGWSWLTEALAHSGAAHSALGGTVTQASSVRFGDIAGPRSDDLEIRASWTPTDDPTALGRHAEAFYALVTSAAGLPPVDVRPLTSRPG